MTWKITGVDVRKGTTDIVRYIRDNNDNVGVAELQQQKTNNQMIEPADILDKDGNVKTKVDDKIKNNKLGLKVREVDE